MSKRVIIILTNYYLESEWKCPQLCALIKKTCLNDPDSVLMIVNRTNLSKRELRKILTDYELKDCCLREEEKLSFCTKLKYSFNKRLCHSLALNDVEVLDYKNPSFWSHFFYIMPHNCNKQKQKNNGANFTDISNQATPQLCQEAITFPKAPTPSDQSSIVQYVQSSSVYEKTVTEFEPIDVRCRAPEYVLVEHRYIDGGGGDDNCFHETADIYDNRNRGRANLNVSFARENELINEQQPYYTSTTRHDCYTKAEEPSPYITATTLNNQRIVDSSSSNNVNCNQGHPSSSRMFVNSRFQDCQDLNSAQMSVSMDL